MVEINFSSSSQNGTAFITIQLPEEKVRKLSEYAQKKGETIVERATRVLLRHIKQLEESEEIRRWTDGKPGLIIDVIPSENFSLHLKFDDDVEGDFDMEPIIRRGGKYSAIEGFASFKQVVITRGGESLSWPNHFELEGDIFYRELVWQSKQAIWNISNIVRPPDD